MDARRSRPRPQCWEHGCNGREFATSDTLLQRKKFREEEAQRERDASSERNFPRLMEIEKMEERISQRLREMETNGRRGTLSWERRTSEQMGMATKEMKKEVSREREMVREEAERVMSRERNFSTRREISIPRDPSAESETFRPGAK